MIYKIQYSLVFGLFTVLLLCGLALAAELEGWYKKGATWEETLQQSRANLLEYLEDNDISGEEEQAAWDRFWHLLRIDFPELGIDQYQQTIQQATVMPEVKGARQFHVAKHGDDSNSGTKEKPFASIRRARDAIRQLKQKHGALDQPVRVLVHAGTYEIADPIRLGPEDSGSSSSPIIYEAAPGEKVVLSGGRRLKTEWQTDDGQIYYTDLPAARDGKWKFRQLFVDGQREILARYPNFDSTDINEAGYLRAGGNQVLAGLQKMGDWFEYQFRVPVDGEYAIWLGYATVHDRPDQFLRVSVDSAVINLPQLSAGKDWRHAEYSQVGKIALESGIHTVRIANTSKGQNRKVHLDALLFTTSDTIQIRNTQDLPPETSDEARVIIQAEDQRARRSGSSSMGARVYPVPVDWASRKLVRPNAKSRILLPADSLHTAWSQDPQAEVFAWVIEGWGNLRARIDTIQSDGLFDIMYLSGYEAATEIRPGFRYYVYNVLDELDSPGEWYLDYETGRLYYWPRQGHPESHTIIAPVTNTIFALQANVEKAARTKHVYLNGFQFRYTDYSTDHPAWRSSPDATVDLQNAWHCGVLQSTFKNVGGYAIRLYQDSNLNLIMHNTVTQAGAGGTILTGPIVGRRGRLPFLEDTSLAQYFAPLGNRITSNHVSKSGKIKRYVAGVHADPRPKILSYAPGNVITHHLIHDMPRNGIFTFSNWGGDIMAYNHIFNVLLETDDGGPIHLCSSNEDIAPNRIHHNVIHNAVAYNQILGKGIPGKGFGIYLDNYTSHTRVDHNVISNTAGGHIFYHHGLDNTAENNLLVSSHRRQLRFTMHWTDNKFLRNVIVWSDSTAKYLTYSKMERNYRPQDYANLNYNILWNENGTIRVNDINFREWQARGFDRQSAVLDPLLVDPQQPELGLKENSPAYQLGFKPIDVSQVGLLLPETSVGLETSGYGK